MPKAASSASCRPLVGSIQATETVKLILGKGETLSGRLILYDALNMKFRELKLRKNPDCPVCGPNRTIHELIDYEEFCGIPQAEPEPAPGSSEWEIDPVELKEKLDRGENVYILDVREPHEFEICSIPNSHLIPLGDLPKRVNELDTADDIVAHCKSGMPQRQSRQLPQDRRLRQGQEPSRAAS